MKILVCLLLVTFSVFSWAHKDDLNSVEKSATSAEIQTTLNGMEPVPLVVQKCWSARKCTGKVLSNRDAHNCKVKSRGKSWSNSAGACYNL